MSVKSKIFSLDFVSPYLLYDYVEDKKEMVRIDTFVMPLSSSISHPKIATNDVSLEK